MLEVNNLLDDKLYIRRGPNGIVMWATGKWWKEYIPFAINMKRKDDQILIWGASSN